MAKSKPALVQLAEIGVDVRLMCNACGHWTVAPAGALVARLGEELTVDAVARHARCAHCGSRDIQSRPHWSTGSRWAV